MVCVYKVNEKGDAGGDRAIKLVFEAHTSAKAALTLVHFTQ